MRLAFFRLKGLKKFIVIINVVLIMIYTDGPNLQADAYKKTAAVKYEEESDDNYYSAGYPADKNYPKVCSVAEIVNKEYYDTFTIITDVKNMQPTHVYRNNITKGGKYKSTIWRTLVNNVEEGGVGQYYILTLDSQEKIIIFLDDTAIDLPKSGKVTLPIGAYLRGGSEDKHFAEMHEKYQITGEATTFYVNMSGSWRESDEAMEVEDIRTDRCFYFSVFLIGTEVLIYVIARKLGKKLDRSYEEIGEK